MSEQYHGKRPRNDISFLAIVLLLVLLIFPALAVLRIGQSFDLRFVGGYAFLVSIVTWFLYRHDKRQAQSGEWRTPESTLHMAELLGGWPGAFLAQRILRHKISKISYQMIFWMIVGLHEFIAFDFMQDWRYLRDFARLFRG